MKKIIVTLSLALAFCASEANAQSFLKKLGNRVVDRVERKVEYKATSTVDRKVDDVLNGNIKVKSKKDKNSTTEQVQTYSAEPANVEAITNQFEENGEFVSHNIHFKKDKSSIKEESMTELVAVAEFMKEYPDLKFEVQCHSYNQSSDKKNLSISQERAEQVVKTLEGLGVDGFNLRAVGKGNTEPLTDTSSKEGRSQNNRVAFVLK